MVRGWVLAVCIAIDAAVNLVHAAPTIETTPGKIRNSKHDLSRNPVGDRLRGEICIYCHTPHNAVMNIPLWNRNNPTHGFYLYNSPTLTPATRQSGFTVFSISLFCMSCHDGITGLGDVRNRNIVGGLGYGYGIQISEGASNTLGVIPFRPVENASFGDNLMNSHPVGFEFPLSSAVDNGIRDRVTVQAIFEERRRAGDPNGRYPAATPATDFLYGPTGTTFECASCHRVHDPGTSGNFLRIENDRSELCLACHNK